MENYMICNCKQVSYFDVEDALHKAEPTENLEEMFREVQDYELHDGLRRLPR